jgi:hypothetical protein
MRARSAVVVAVLGALRSSRAGLRARDQRLPGSLLLADQLRRRDHLFERLYHDDLRRGGQVDRRRRVRLEPVRGHLPRPDGDAGTSHPYFEIVPSMSTRGPVPGVGYDGKNSIIFQTTDWTDMSPSSSRSPSIPADPTAKSSTPTWRSTRRRPRQPFGPTSIPARLHLSMVRSGLTFRLPSRTSSAISSGWATPVSTALSTRPPLQRTTRASRSPTAPTPTSPCCAPTRRCATGPIGDVVRPVPK